MLEIAWGFLIIETHDIQTIGTYSRLPVFLRTCCLYNEVIKTCANIKQYYTKYNTYM